ncbi:MAG: DUF427 domain-containing protein [Spirochaetota bacterium]
MPKHNRKNRESVWDYPRPPAVEKTTDRVQVTLGGKTIADTTRALRVLETSHPPTYYIPRSDIVEGALEPTRGSSFCEYKGRASYFDVVSGDTRARAAAWIYPSPTAAYQELADAVAFYPGLMEACFVDGEQIDAQAGSYYGGWITSNITGPFKGAPGTGGW